MILEKEKLDLAKLVLYPNLNKIVPSNYKIGTIDNKIVVWNSDTDVYMENYYDDVGDEETQFGLEPIYGKVGSKFRINRRGEIFGGKGKILKYRLEKGYPTVIIRNKENGEETVSKNVKIHKCLALLFIPNIDPKNKIYVDHINRDKTDYSLSNLRWVTAKENKHNTKNPERKDPRIFRAYSDQKLTSLVSEFTLKELKNKFGHSIREKDFQDRIKEGKPFHGYYWSIENTYLTEYLKMIEVDANNIDNSLWVKHFSTGYLIHPLGLVKKTEESLPTPGCIKDEGHIRLERSFGAKRTTVHKAVAEVFLNNNSALPEGMIIDHINTNSLDNRVENLKICTQKENMANPLSRQKLSKKVIDSKGVIYNSVSECAEAYNIALYKMYKLLNGGRESLDDRFKYYKENNN